MSIDALAACDQLLAALVSEIEAANRAGAAAFGQGDHDAASKRLAQARALQSLCDDALALGIRLRELIGRAPELDPGAATQVSESSRQSAAPLSMIAPVGQFRGAPAQPIRTVPPKPAQKKLPKGLKTPEDAYRKQILSVLVSMGGRGEMSTVLERVYERMKPVLNQYDREPVPTGTAIRWRNTAMFCRAQLKREGLLKADSPHGVWEISEAGRRWLRENG